MQRRRLCRLWLCSTYLVVHRCAPAHRTVVNQCSSLHAATYAGHANAGRGRRSPSRRAVAGEQPHRSRRVRHRPRAQLCRDRCAHTQVARHARLVPTPNVVLPAGDNVRQGVLHFHGTPAITFFGVKPRDDGWHNLRALLPMHVVQEQVACHARSSAEFNLTASWLHCDMRSRATDCRQAFLQALCDNAHCEAMIEAHERARG